MDHSRHTRNESSDVRSSTAPTIADAALFMFGVLTTSTDAFNRDSRRTETRIGLCSAAIGGLMFLGLALVAGPNDLVIAAVVGGGMGAAAFVWRQGTAYRALSGGSTDHK